MCTPCNAAQRQGKTSKALSVSRTRVSETAGWDRLYDKYSPSKEIELSPIKASQANLSHVIPKLKDKYLDLYIWVINMSEQFFYDNAFLLLSYSKHDKKQMMHMLHRGCIGVDMNFFKNLKDVTLLGEGSFGTVYSCIDPKTNVKFAVKQLLATFSKYTDHAENLLDYMDERNAIIRAMDSPLIVKFYYSLQIKANGALFLFFEFCIGDLVQYIEHISIEDTQPVSVMLYKNSSNILDKIYEDNPELLEVNFMYIFEMLCGLDFLVKCNIIHQDIKPDNIMIAGNLHLKIGDFGLVYKTRTIHRETNKILVKVDDINTSESTNFELATPGTPYYHDFEILLMKLEDDNVKEFTDVTENVKKFDTPNILYKFSVLEPTFLTDTWAVGVSALFILFRGFEMFNPKDADINILKDIPRKTAALFVINLIAQQKYYKPYIEKGLMYAGGSNHRSLMMFLASIFKPRRSRCKGYTKIKKLYHFTELRKMRYIDMDKIERIRTFSELNLSSSNVHLRDVPEFIRKYFVSNKKPLYSKFEKVLKKLEVTTTARMTRSSTLNKPKNPFKVLDVDPGININFFN